MKLEIGMHVRDNRDGEITKITEFDLRFRINKNTYEFEKASFNIIDLIEAGDYVNNYEVIDSSEGLGILAPTIDINEMNSCIDKGLIHFKFYSLKDIKIKSIVTKEQFENMEYIVGDSNE